MRKMYKKTKSIINTEGKEISNSKNAFVNWIWDFLFSIHNELQCKSFSTFSLKVIKLSSTVIENTTAAFLQTKLVKLLDFQNSNLEILPESEFGFCRVDQNSKYYLFAFNIMNHNSCSFTATFNCQGYLVIYNESVLLAKNGEVIKKYTLIFNFNT